VPGQGLRGVGTVQDITARRQVEDELRLAATVFDASLNAVLIADAEGRIRKINRAFTAILGYEEADVLGRNPSVMQSGQHALSFYQDLWGQLLESGHWEGEVLNRHRDGRIVPIWESITAVRDEQGAVSHYIGIFSDISEQKAQARRIHQLAYYDALTGLPNRTLLMDRCRQALSRAKRATATWPCSSWTWTASSTSTTAWATRWATPCCRPWPAGCSRWCATPTPWPAWAATSSWCCWRTWNRRWMSMPACSASCRPSASPSCWRSTASRWAPPWG
jgi:PAS domain S-box-containing protein